MNIIFVFTIFGVIPPPHSKKLHVKNPMKDVFLKKTHSYCLSLKNKNGCHGLNF